MKYSHSALLGLLSFCLGVFFVIGCAATVEEDTPYTVTVHPTQEGSQMTNELEKQPEQNDGSSDDCDAIKKELEAEKAVNRRLSTRYDELKVQYDELNVRYNTLAEEQVEASEADVEEALFALINKERETNGLSALEQTRPIYQEAENHNNIMVASKRLELSENSYVQEIFRTTGYSTLDRMTNATLKIWKESTFYEGNFLDNSLKYGAVAVSMSDDIFYITYFASTQK